MHLEKLELDNGRVGQAICHCHWPPFPRLPTKGSFAFFLIAVAMNLGFFHHKKKMSKELQIQLV